MDEPLTIEFHRSAGEGRREIRGTFPDIALEPDDVRAWLGTEPPHRARRPDDAEHPADYTLVFRRGGERRVVTLRDGDVDARLRPLIDRLVRLIEG